MPRPHPKPIRSESQRMKPLHWYTENSPRDSNVQPELRTAGRKGSNSGTSQGGPSYLTEGGGKANG